MAKSIAIPATCGCLGTLTTLAFSRLFQQPEYRAWLEQAIAQHLQDAPHITDSQTGHLLLAAMLNDKVACTRNELFADRRACCRTRDAHPKRPTEVIPVGVIGLESILHFPADAAFRYAIDDFPSTEDDQIADSIAAYHVLYQ